MPTLFQFQIEGKEFLKRHRVALLADVMGLGKTCQALVAATELVREKQARNKVLIVVPKRLLLNWGSEIEKWRIPLDITLVNYRSLFKLPEAKYDIVIADEAHKLKNPSTQQSKEFFKKFAKHARYTWFLTGTPVKRCTTDLYPFVRHAGIYSGSYQDFCKRFAIEDTFVRRGKPNRKGQVRKYIQKVYKGGKNLRSLKKLMSKCMLRRFRKDVLTELPDKLHHTVLLTADTTGRYLPYLDQVEDVLEACSAKILPPDERKEIATLRRELGLSKIEACLDFVLDITEQTEEQVIIFAHHRSVVLGTSDALDARGFTVGTIVGGQSQIEYENTLKAWHAGRLQYLVISMGAGAEGLTLTEACKAFFFELPWNPSTLDQACCRIHRIGQKEITNIYFLLMKDSFDMAVRSIILNKKRVAHEVVGIDR